MLNNQDMDILIDVLRNMEDNNITSIKELSEIMEAKIDADKQYKADEIRTAITATIMLKSIVHYLH